MKLPMRHLITIQALVAIGVATAAEPPAPLPPGAALVKRIEWKSEKLADGAKVAAGGPEGAGYVTITNAETAPMTVPLWSSSAPGIHTKCYALRGMLRYHEVEGIGYFNLWNEFAGPEVTSPKSSYFSRTLAEIGPLQKITGSSDWRPAVIPFDATQAKGQPTRLELDLVLAGKGRVDLTDLELLEFADAGAMWGALGVNAVSSKPVSDPRKRWGTAAVSGCAGILLLSAAAAMLWRRRQAEMRRMRAMDAS